MILQNNIFLEYEEKWKESDKQDLADIKFSRLSPPFQVTF